MSVSNEDDDESEMTKQEEPTPRRRVKKIHIPRRAPSVVVPERKVVYTTADKTTCIECPCYPKEDPYDKRKKLNPCLKTPLTLYELAAKVVDALPLPKALEWRETEVVEWMDTVVGLPQYTKSILDNHINGRRLLWLEDSSNLPEINIHNFEHIKMITSKVRELFSTEFIKFARSIALPPRMPLTHCTWFKSRTGPTWGIRMNWSRTDIFRWMKILMPEPIYMNHWDLVWYHKPEFPKVKLARIPKPVSQVHIPRYIKGKKEVCLEYLVKRKFRVQKNIPEDAQYIWMEHRPGSAQASTVPEETTNKKFTVPKKSRLDPKKINLKGLAGKELLLARRKMPRPKFLV